MVLLQLKEAVELFVKRREFLADSGVLSRRDMAKAVKSDANNHSVLPSLQCGNDLDLNVKVIFQNPFLQNTV